MGMARNFELHCQFLEHASYDCLINPPIIRSVVHGDPIAVTTDTVRAVLQFGEDGDTPDGGNADDDDSRRQIRIAINRKAETASVVSRSVKMRKRKEDDTDKEYHPDEDLDPSIVKGKKAKSNVEPKRLKVSRPKFVTTPLSTILQGMDLLQAIFSTATTTTTTSVTSVSTPPTSIPTSSTQQTPETERLLDSLINTPPIVTSTTTTSIPTSTIPIPVTTTVAPTSTFVPPTSSTPSSSSFRLRDEYNDFTDLVSTWCI
ncbi:hypothetical protein L1987_48397 [Smallanthus sonchifolius]|uniref:Uncharacterized protein n=1 Tax=Smallanthus sonchifolius TaxID=185202 RepID=A0ACB9FR75_9ASTR|nr:hypothetical protein L1987_48397 [Smallanthus sonchifolius]